MKMPLRKELKGRKTTILKNEPAFLPYQSSAKCRFRPNGFQPKRISAKRDRIFSTYVGPIYHLSSIIICIICDIERKFSDVKSLLHIGENGNGWQITAHNANSNGIFNEFGNSQSANP
jgi:hypothetical protein